MRKLMLTLAVGLILAFIGCATGQKSGDGQGISKDTKVRCPKCGVEFRIKEGM